ncbi:MAG: SDR family oxidoreductase [Candidatus Abyssobacteria bacterium SURF_5]|uniref:SDR family oxidoreductase n=1 Tax=Abyssobacteria bacterium (strain SURF_5) TaxID=2093360 RepID=A0A3A4P1I6_ABYX5|nr:MAG: SDR family oxidoreductase [Candidatus Abyssubacteria bacterium SURF_5]
MAHALELFKLDGKVAVVTGGSRGLGFHAAEGLAEAGADVAICSRSVSASLDEAVEKLRKTGRNCMAFECNITKEDEVAALAKNVKEHYGRCDILVNNAGIGTVVPSTDMSAGDWTNMMNTNLLGAFLCCQQFGRFMIEQNSGCIINFSSENGQVGFAVGMAAYATSKIGLVGLTRSLAVEWGKHNIRVNAILPGNMEEGMMETLKDKESFLYQLWGEKMLGLIPLNSFGTGDDIKGAVVFLASDAARYISGAKIVVDGGFTINAGI